MDDLIIQWLRGRATPEEERRLKAWRCADPDNERQARDMERLWRLAGEVEPPLFAGRAFALRERAASAGAVAGRASAQPRRKGFAGRGRAVVAGAAAAAVVALGVVLVLDHAAVERGSSVTVAEFRTGADEMVTIDLSDGTTVRLAPRSRLRFGDGRTGQRQVWLDGHAFFAVAPRSGRTPFIVRTPTGDAHVLGTRFDIKADSEDLRVVVLDGRVALSTLAGSVEVGAGQLGRARPGEDPVVESVADIDAVTEWMGRSLIFQNNSLAQVVGEIEHRYGVRIRVEDSDLGRETVTASFTGESFEEVMSVLCRLLGARCSVEEGSATISSY